MHDAPTSIEPQRGGIHPDCAAHPLAAALLALAGFALLGVGAHWVAGADGMAEAFEVSWFGGVLGEWSRSEAIEWGAAAAAWPRAALGVVALLLGMLTAAWLDSKAAPGARPVRRIALGLALAAAIFFALDPALLTFVSTRNPAGATAYLDVGHAARALGIGLLLGAAFVSGRGFRRTALEPRAGGGDAEDSRPRRRLVIASLAAAGSIVVLFSELGFRLALDGEPLTNDGRAYLFQSELFARAHFVLASGDWREFFPARQIYFGDERIFSKYPPGHSGLLACGQLVGSPLFFVRFAAGLTPTFVYLLARRAGIRRALFAAWLFALSPMVIGVEAMVLSHGTSLPFGLAALAAGAACIDAGRGTRALAPTLRLAALTGALIAVVGLARPGTALALTAALLLAASFEVPRRAFGIAVAAAVAGLPALAIMAWHNHASTGSAWLTPYALYARDVSPNDRWGLVNLGTAWPNTAFNLSRLDAWAFGFAPGLVLPALGLLWRPGDSSNALRHRALLLGAPLALIGFYSLLRFHGVPWAGPLYFVEGLGCLAILAAVGVERLTSVFGSRVPTWILCASVIGSASILIPQWRAAAVEARARRAPAAALDRLGLERALVFVAIEREVDRRRLNLSPPTGSNAGAARVFARDLGAHNALLMRVYPELPAYRFDPQQETLQPLSSD